MLMLILLPLRLYQHVHHRGVGTMRQWLITIGIVLVAVGVLWPWLTKLGLGRLPGDVIINRGNFGFYFPIVTCLIVSVVLSFIFWLFNR
jgi:Protein of unknown function (DUF2905)